MIPSVPSLYHEILSPEAVQDHVRQLAAAIEPWAAEAYEASGESPLAVCILRGGVLFFADLVRAIPVSLQLAFCHCRSYSSASNEALKEGVEVEMDRSVLAGRSVLLIDDICDSGGTFNYLRQFVLKHGATDVRTAAFVFRDHDRSIFRPDYAAFTFKGEDWFVGYGMEDRNKFMNLPGLYTIDPATAGEPEA